MKKRQLFSLIRTKESYHFTIDKRLAYGLLTLILSLYLLFESLLVSSQISPAGCCSSTVVNTGFMHINERVICVSVPADLHGIYEHT
jgi:hypothetical protein